MPYLIQADEEPIPYDLLQQLAKVMDESEELTFADATLQLQHAHGILQVADQAEAERLSARFIELGFRNFILEKLLDVPAPEQLNLQTPFTEVAEVMTVARVDLEKERTERTFDPLQVQLTSYNFPILGTGVEEHTITEHDTRFYLDLFTQNKRWQAHPGSLLPILEFLKTFDTTHLALSVSMQKLLAGERNLQRFRKEKDYQRHVSWMYQVKYARGWTRTWNQE